jgi:hypothetical protein
MADTFRNTETEGMGPGVRRDDVERVARISHRSFLGPSVIAARKFLHVSGRFRFSLRQGEGAKRRKAHRNSAAACLPDRRKTEAHGNASRRPAAAFLSLGPCFRHKFRTGFRPPFTCPVQPLKAEPRSGLGRLPKASRVREARPPRPQAPHPAPRYKRPGNAPLTGAG